MTSNTLILCDALRLICLLVILGCGWFLLIYTKVVVEWICQGVRWKELGLRVAIAVPFLFIGYLYLFLFCWTFVSLPGNL